MDDIKVVTLTAGTCGQWDAFCMESDDAWFWHTAGWRAYSLILRPQRKSVDHSFMLYKGDELFAVCPLISELNEDGKKQFSFGGLPCPLPAVRRGLSREKKEKIRSDAFAHIDSLARQAGVSRALFKADPLSFVFIDGADRYNHLVKYGYLDVSLATQVIDLSHTPEELSGAVTKGHNYDIDKAGKELEVAIYTKDTMSREIFDGYRLLHQKAAGRVTRPLETFEMMYQWIRKGNAFLACAAKGSVPVAYSLFIAYKQGAYYASSCTEPADEFSKLCANHLIQWKVIEFLKENGYRRYEIGWQQFGCLLHDFPTEKDIAISRFKRGFGGACVPLCIGEKYFSAAYFVQVYSRRVQQYASHIGHP